MFDMKIKFETVIRVKVFDKDFEDILNLCGGRTESPYTEHTVEHTMTLTNAEVIPDKNWLENAEKIIFETMKDNFQKDTKINATVISTKFVGFTDIEQK